MNLKWTCESLKEASLTVRSKVDNAVATVGTRIHDSTLAAMDSLVGGTNPQISQCVFFGQDPGIQEVLYMIQTEEISQEKLKAFK